VPVIVAAATSEGLLIYLGRTPASLVGPVSLSAYHECSDPSAFEDTHSALRRASALLTKRLKDWASNAP